MLRLIMLRATLSGIQIPTTTSRKLVNEVMVPTVVRPYSEAVSMLSEREPNLILFDMRLPGMSGEDFAAEVERRGLRPRIPMVLLTGDPHGRQFAQEVGAEWYLEKPVGLADLLEVVARLTGGPPGEARASAA